MYRIGLLLCGCGELDGSDPAQAVAIWARAEQAGAELVACAPDRAQGDALHPLTGSALPARNALAESARLTRSACRPLAAVTAHHLDALVVPGGLGVLKTLSDAGVTGAAATLEPQTERLLRELRLARKPVAALGEAVVLVALAWRDRPLRLACGADDALSALVRSLGHQPCSTGPTELVADDTAGVVTGSPRMGLQLRPAVAAAEGVVERLLAWLRQPS